MLQKIVEYKTDNGKIEFALEGTSRYFVPIKEAQSFERFQTHVKNGFIGISASRKENSPEKNKALTKKMKGDLKELHYGYWGTIGGYLDTNVRNNPDKVADLEDSFIIPYTSKMGSFDQMFKTLMKIGDEYNQESLLIVPPNDPKGAFLFYLRNSDEPYTVYAIGNKLKIEGTHDVAEKTLMFFTQLRRNGSRKPNTPRVGIDTTSWDNPENEGKPQSEWKPRTEACIVGIERVRTQGGFLRMKEARQYTIGG